MADGARATAEFARTRDWLTAYFDGHAAETWKNLTSGGPVGWVRETVRAGRARTEANILSWLPPVLDGWRILDAGCGTGRVAAALAARGASVTAVDVAGSLVAQGRARATAAGVADRIRFVAGDMLDPTLGSFDWVVAMDSLVHYEPAPLLHALGVLGRRTRAGMTITLAPSTVALEAMHFVGRLLPAGSRAPAIVPIHPGTLSRALADGAALAGWAVGRTDLVRSGFYTSRTIELCRAAAGATAPVPAAVSPLSPEA